MLFQIAPSKFIKLIFLFLLSLIILFKLLINSVWLNSLSFSNLEKLIAMASISNPPSGVFLFLCSQLFIKFKNFEDPSNGFDISL